MKTEKRADRTLFEVGMDICYYIRLSELHERLYARLDKAIKVAELVSGSGAFVTLLKGAPSVAAVLTAAVVILSIVSLVFDFGGRARAMADSRAKYEAVRVTSLRDGISVARAETALARAGAGSPTIIEALRLPAFNSNLKGHGFEDKVMPLSRWERFVDAIA